MLLWRLGAFLGNILLVFILAWFLAFLLNPFVDLLSFRRKMPRPAAAGITYLAIAGMIVLAGFFLAPPAVAQAERLGNKLPTYTQNPPSVIDDLQTFLDKRHIKLDLHQLVTSEDASKAAKWLGDHLQQNAANIAQGAFQIGLDTVLVVILSFYMMVDAPRITAGLLRITPLRYRDDMRRVVRSVDHSFGGYARASIMIAAIYWSATSVTMAVLGIPFALPVGGFAGLMLLIPFVGDVIAVIPTIVIGLFTVSLLEVVIATAVMIGMQQITLQFLRPKIMGDSVGLHPIWVLAAFFIGAQAAGVWGALFSIPFAAIIQTIVQLMYSHNVEVGEERAGTGEYLVADGATAPPAQDHAAQTSREEEVRTH